MRSAGVFKEARKSDTCACDIDDKSADKYGKVKKARKSDTRAHDIDDKSADKQGKVPDIQIR